MKMIFYVLLVPLLSSCVAYPKKIVYFDEECGIESKKLVLETNPNARCQGDECRKKIPQILSREAIERMVAGTIIIAGNTIYWLEKKSECKELKID